MRTAVHLAERLTGTDPESLAIAAVDSPELRERCSHCERIYDRRTPHGSRRIGRTIILIGAPMTVDDGSTLHSRQPVTVYLRIVLHSPALAARCCGGPPCSSLSVRSLYSAGNDPYALVIGNRSVVELLQDSRLRRTALRSILSAAQPL